MYAVKYKAFLTNGCEHESSIMVKATNEAQALRLAEYHVAQRVDVRYVKAKEAYKAS